MAKHKHVYVEALSPVEATRQAEAAKTTRLRALRLAKEAADRDAASRATAVSAAPRRRGRASQTP